MLTLQGARANAFQVTELPGFGPPPTKHYSGFLDAKAGCATTEAVCRIHYWFCSAEGSAASAPVYSSAPHALHCRGMLACARALCCEDP